LASAGLLEAIDHFDPGRGAPFRAYARRRITGSVLDGIAKMSEVREQISFRNRVRHERVRSLAVADAEALPLEDAMRALADLAVGLALGFMLEGTGLYVDEDQQSPQADAYESLAWKDTVRGVVQELSKLPDRERSVIRRHYLDGLAFEQISVLLGVSKSRVSQLHKAGLDLLRRTQA
jgi:RNA polymerase sigma factor for flagellar operon FliA